MRFYAGGGQMVAVEQRHFFRETNLFEPAM
jgi:hypothetical protein